MLPKFIPIEFSIICEDINNRAVSSVTTGLEFLFQGYYFFVHNCITLLIRNVTTHCKGLIFCNEEYIFMFGDDEIVLATLYALPLLV